MLYPSQVDNAQVIDHFLNMNGLPDYNMHTIPLVMSSKVCDVADRNERPMEEPTRHRAYIPTLQTRLAGLKFKGRLPKPSIRCAV